MKFEKDPKLQSAINNYVDDLLRDPYTNDLRTIKALSILDKEDIGKEFAEAYLDEYPDDYNKEKVIDSLGEYVSKTIDKLIPKAYFIRSKAVLCDKYNNLLVRRIYDIDGKDGLEETKSYIYQYEHDFSDITSLITNTTASDKQIEFLKKLGEKMGYLLWNEKYISKTNANQMIEYLSEKIYDEPVIFPFFFVSK